jgi:hypothetical protein
MTDRNSDADRLSDGNLRLVLREKHYAVQWQFYGDWVTHSRQHTTKEDALHELHIQKGDEREDWKKLNWRAVEITRTVRRLDDEDSGG